MVLGTASQVPTKRRNHNGYFLKWDGEGFLFDPGEGIQRQMTRFGVSVSEITKIFITHFHGDHCLGLAGVIQRISLDRVAHVVEIYYPKSGQRYYENLLHASIFHNVAKIRPCPIQGEGEIFRDQSLTISTLPLSHSVETWGYRIQERDSVNLIPDKLKEFGLRGPVVGKLKSEGEVFWGGRRIFLEEVSRFRRGQVMAFVMDTRFCANAVELSRGADMLVCEATYLSSEAEEAREHGHLTAAQAAEIARRGGVGLLVLTHFSQRYFSFRPFLEEARRIHRNVVVAEDGKRIGFPRRRREIGGE